MLDDRQGECNSRIVVDASSDRSMTWNEIGNLPEKKLSQVQVDGSFFLASEDDVIGVEHLLAEPKCNDLGGSFLGFDTSSTQNCFDIEEFSALERAYIKIESGNNLINL